MNKRFFSKVGFNASTLYLVLTLGAFAVLTVIFLFFPRSVYSKLEKRDLAEVPTPTLATVKTGEYTEAVSHWFNDTEPYRDHFMEMSMGLRDKMHIVVGGEEAVRVQLPDKKPEPPKQQNAGVKPGSQEEYPDVAPEEGVTKIAHDGIVLLGTEPNVRAMMMYGGHAGGETLVKTIKHYGETMPDIQMYELVVPLASEFYLPKKMRKEYNSQLGTIENIKKLTEGTGIRHVDAYHALKRHADENIYMRTDHHWAGLGAFYAAEQFAKVAGVPFRQLAGNYETRVLHNTVGSMYGFSHDIAVKKSPEDFVYHVPSKVPYTTTITDYTVNKKYEVVSESKPYKTEFFKTMKDGTGNAYCTYMGQDAVIAKVQTGVNNGRRLLVIKDSFGNAFPGYMFYSFEEVHVVDFRYFTPNIKRYASENGITDMLFLFNIFNAYSPGTSKRLEKFLTQ